MELFSVQMQRLQEIIVPRLVMLVLLVMAMFEIGQRSWQCTVGALGNYGQPHRARELSLICDA